MSVSFGSKAGLSLRTAGPALRPPTDKLGDEPALLRTEYELLIRAIDHGQHSCGTLVYSSTTCTFTMHSQGRDEIRGTRRSAHRAVTERVSQVACVSVNF